MRTDTSDHPPTELISDAEAESGNGEPIFPELDATGSSGELVEESQSDAAAVPEWFSRKRAKQTQQKESASSVSPLDERAPKIAIAAAEEQEQLSWQEKLARWIVSFAAIGYGTSLILHMVLILTMSIIIFEKVSGDKPFSTLLGESEELETDFGEALDTRIEVPGDEIEILELPQLKTVELPEATIRQPVLSAELHERLLAAVLGSGAGANQGHGKGSGFKFAMPKGDKVITKGSFTAWTVPADPAPREAYVIVIQIKLPKRIRRYRLRDLSGMVVGTDGYRQNIPEHVRGYLRVKNHQTQLVVAVPGAERLVKDTIVIRSRMLKEEQTLKIVF